MKVKTKEELLALDEELNLFEESDWNFLDVQDGDSLEYFNDIRDDDFVKRGKKELIRYFSITIVACSIFIICGVWLYNVTVGRNILTDGNPSSTDDKVVSLERVDGAIGVSNDEYIEISKVLSSYFNILESESSYEVLNNFCLTSSTFYEMEKLYREKMQYSYDINDCYSRALRCFGKYFSVSKINEVIVKDDTYYVYIDLNYPDKDALTEYFYIYASDMTKFFISNEINEMNVVRYIIQLSDTYGMPTSSKEICIEVIKDSNNEFLIVDDSFVTSDCTSSYNHAISQVVKILGGTKATTQY